MEADAPVDSQCRTQEEQEREQCHQYQQHPRINAQEMFSTVE